MALCYHKEVFISGFVIAYFTFGIFILFGDVILGWFGRIQNIIK